MLDKPRMNKYCICVQFKQQTKPTYGNRLQNSGYFGWVMIGRGRKETSMMPLALFLKEFMWVFTLKKYIELYFYGLWAFLDTLLYFNKKFKWKQNVAAMF